ncbi:MAG: tRNA guanosine(34) transglycosylase Tgt [Patescibacteria group bacterium]|jgi:queuine tRNA-ribosyltransferase
MAIKFDILAKDGQARAGVLQTDHGEVHTPTITVNFTPALLRSGLSANRLQELGVEMVLTNTLHTMMEGQLQAPDIHEQLSWNGPVFADSGGFQMVSLAKNMRVEKDGIKFSWDDAEHKITPAQIVEWQKQMGVDIIMPLDRVWHLRQKNPFAYLESVLTTEKWFRESQNISNNVFYILQGGLNKWARALSLKYANKHLKDGIAGIAIGGLAFGEQRSKMYNMIDFCNSQLPEDKPRHLLGVGEPVDLLESIERGIDTFDCVAHTREARHGRLLTSQGYLRLRRAEYASDNSVIEVGCDCPTCRTGISRRELRAGMKSSDPITRQQTLIKLMLHNIRFLMRLMEQSRTAISQNRFNKFKKEFIVNFRNSVK